MVKIRPVEIYVWSLTIDIHHVTQKIFVAVWNTRNPNICVSLGGLGAFFDKTFIFFEAAVKVGKEESEVGIYIFNTKVLFLPYKGVEIFVVYFSSDVRSIKKYILTLTGSNSLIR